jgi:hypothetical protein
MRAKKTFVFLVAVIVHIAVWEIDAITNEHVVFGLDDYDDEQNHNPNSRYVIYDSDGTGDQTLISNESNLMTSNTRKRSMKLRVMTFNIHGGGANEDRSIQENVNVILVPKDVDVIGIQETRAEGSSCNPDNCPPPPTGGSVAQLIAEALGYYY